MNKIFHEIDIEINSNCNRTCWYCPNHHNSRIESGEMSQETFTLLMTQLASVQYHGKICFHFYNEPLLCSKLELFIDISKKYLPQSKQELVSNGTLLTKEKMERLFHIGIDQMIITKHDGESELPLDKFYSSLTNEYKEKLKYNSHSELKLTSRAGEIKQFQSNKNPLPISKPCFIPSLLTVVTVNGNVLTCYEDYNQKIQMGNIRERNIIEIWQSEEYVKFRNDLKNGLRKNYNLCSMCENLKTII